MKEWDLLLLICVSHMPTIKCLVVADVEDVKYVINFDYPNSSEDYIHRIGRTGRCQQAGTAYTFFTPGNQRQARELIAVLSEAHQDVNPRLMELASLAKNTFGGQSACFIYYVPSFRVVLNGLIYPAQLYWDEVG